MTTPPRQRPAVLRDHKRVGKRFIPPFVAQIGPPNEVHWPTEILPELLWLALLNERHQWHRGAELARQVGVAAHGAYREHLSTRFAAYFLRVGTRDFPDLQADIIRHYVRPSA